MCSVINYFINHLYINKYGIILIAKIQILELNVKLIDEFNKRRIDK